LAVDSRQAVARHRSSRAARLRYDTLDYDYDYDYDNDNENSGKR